MLQRFFVLATAIMVVPQLVCSAPQGYHYDNPNRDRISTHQFAGIPTVAPLPAIPSLPALPTAPSRISQQSLVQTHPSGQRTTYQQRPPQPPQQAPQNNYRYTLGPVQPTAAYQPIRASAPQAPAKTFISAYVPQGGAAANRPQQPQIQKSQTLYSGPASGFNTYIPPNQKTFGPSAGGDLYTYMGRNFKQYQVVEIIDNDIERPPPPAFLPRFLNNPRAFVGASGTGALPALGSSANSLIQAQRQLANSAASSGDAVALGSGGLGYIRLPNGSISLGSGSLGYVSGQQRSQSLQEARTRTESGMPDALHFGHGALGGTSFFFG